MSLMQRKELYKSIVAYRNKPLIAYVTSIRPNLSGMMAGDAISSIISQINAIPKEIREIDFLIISNGGDPITALRIIGLLRERFDHISVFLPYVAYSAATVLSLGADEIIMHPFSNLGPVDPQLTVSRKNGQGMQEQLQFSSEDIRNYIEFVRTDVGVSDQQHLISAITPLLTEVGALPIGSAKRGQQLSLSLSEKMLCTHMDDKNKAKTIAKMLNSSYYHHGYAVSRKEALELGLNIIEPDAFLEDALWKLWRDFAEEMKCDDPFDFTKELMNNPAADASISQVPIINLPANTPPQLAQQIIATHAQNIPITTRTSIKIRELVASIESIDLAYAVFSDLDILYWRNPDMSLGVNCTKTGTGWIEYPQEVQNE